MRPSLLAIFLCTAAVSLAAPPAKTISKQTVLDAIMTFRVDPLSEDGRQAGAIVVLFTDQDHDVSVSLRQKTLPFLTDKSLPENYRGAFLAAFVVGNVDSQLLRHQKKDDSYAGLQQLIESYHQMQRKNPKLRVAEIEKFVELEKRGQLKAYAESK